jgi:hypothetical protein
MKQMRNNEPSWMDSYVDGLRAMEGNAWAHIHINQDTF